MGDDRVGPEHLLMGLVVEGEGVAARVLHELGDSAERARAEVTRLLAEPAAVAGQPSSVEARRQSTPTVSLSTDAMQALIRAHELAEAEGAVEVTLDHLHLALRERGDG